MNVSALRTLAADQLEYGLQRDREERVIRVDRYDRAQGFAGKLEVHREGLLHRAFSIFVFNEEGRMLLQRRAASKYHFAGLWSNTCCGHPRPLETTSSAATRRLGEEMGFVSELKEFHELIYRAEDPVSGLIEHEYLHVFRGEFGGELQPDPLEVGDYVWESIPSLRQSLERSPEYFTPWFARLFQQIFPTNTELL